MAFQFPDPNVQDEILNEDTGVLYRYIDPPGKWVAVLTNDSSGPDPDLSAAVDVLEIRADGVDNSLEVLDNRVDTAENRLDTLEAQPAAKEYMIGTDKNITRSVEPRSAPAIELVDSELNFSNVRFEATGGLSVTSTASSIVYDASGLQANVNLDEYYTKTEVDLIDNHLQSQIDELLVTKGEAASYKLESVNFQVAARDGTMYIDNTLVSAVSFLSIAPVDLNGRNRPLGSLGDIIELVKASGVSYRYEITMTDGGGTAGVTHIAGTGNDLLMEGMTFSVYIYPQNKSTASIDYVDNALSQKMGLTGNQDITGTWRVRDTDHTYIRVQNDELSLFNVAYPESDTHVANKKYVDDAVGINKQEVDDIAASYLPLSGGSANKMTGDFHIEQKTILISKADGTKQWKVNPNTSDYFTNIYSFNSGGMRFRVTSDNTEASYKTFLSAAYADNDVGGTIHPVQTQINWLKTPTQGHHAANKHYVDQKVATIVAGDVDLDDHPGGSFTGTVTFAAQTNESPVKFTIGGTKVAEYYIGGSDSLFFEVQPGKEFKITASNSDGDRQQVFKVYPNGEIKLEHLKDPEQSHHAATKGWVESLISGTTSFGLAAEVDQNEEQLQAMSTSLFNALTDISRLKSLDITNALSELSQARQDIIELKSKVLSLEQQANLNLE